MKKTNVFGAVLCSAALAVGMAMPAFAADPVTTADKTGPAVGMDSESLIKVQGTAAPQIAATIPVLVTVSAEELGGEILGPSSDAYKITNNCDQTIVVEKVYGTAAANWELSTSATKLPSNNGTNANNKGLARITLKSTDATDTLTVVGNSSSSASTLKASAWTMAAKNDVVKIELGGEAYPKTNPASTKISDSGEDCVTLTYTIKAA